jgi:hypothetical protein
MIAEREAGMIDVTEAIEKDGFYLTTGQIRLEEREG